MKKGWKECNLEDHINLIDYRGRTPIKTNSGVRLITAKNVKLGYLQLEPQEFINSNDYESWMTRGIPNFGDVIFTTEAPLGNVAQIDTNEKLAFAQRIIVMQPEKNEINQTFLKYMLLSPIVRQRILSKGSGATVQGIKSSLLKKIKISYPQTLSEQQRIVSLLDETFAAIEQAKANVERCMSLSKDLFQSELNSIFSRKGKGWEERQFKDVCVLQRGFDLPTHSRERGIFPLVSSNGITDRINLWKVKGPGVVTGRSGTIGNVHFVDEDFWPLNTSLYIKEFHGNYERCVYYFLKQFDLGKYSTGAGVPTLNRNNVHSIKVYFPISVNKQHQIVERLDALSAATKKLEAKYQAKLNSLEELKKSVLEKAFRGEI